MSNRQIGLGVLLCCVALAATAMAGQHRWTGATSRTNSLRPDASRARAVSGPAGGLYCTDLTEGGAGVHDLGWIPAGFNVDVDVESFTDGLDPVAAVVVASVGVAGGNNVKATTFYDNDSGGNGAARVSFVTPQSGTYVLLVGDQTGMSGGCYRYQVNAR